MARHFLWRGIKILNTGTDNSEQIVQTRIRLLLQEQSDLSLNCLQFHLHLSDTLLHCKTKLLHFSTIIVPIITLVVQIFRIFMVMILILENFKLAAYLKIFIYF